MRRRLAAPPLGVLPSRGLMTRPRRSSCPTKVLPSSKWLLLLLLLLLVLLPPSSAICQPGCDCTEKLIVSCDSKDIDVTPMTFNPSIRQLSIHNTKIHTLDFNSVRWYQELRHINLSQNQISQVGAKTFELTKKVEELHLAENKISHIEMEVFHGLSNLTILSLKGNLLEELTDDIFQHVGKLEHLDVSVNRLTTIGDHTFSPLKNLRVLYLHDNRLSSVPGVALSAVPHLAELTLGNNDFEVIEEKDLQSFSALTVLSLSGANLEHGLSNGSFWNLAGLRTLDLSGCNLKSFPYEAFLPLVRLENVYLNNNLFEEVPSCAFKANKQLRTLEMSGCRHLERLSPHVFDENFNIQRVTIAHNPKLKYIGDSLFWSLSRLDVLHLHANALEYVDVRLAPWRELSLFTLRDNPLECNCSVAWLREFLIECNNSESYLVQCFSPSKLSEKLLIETHMNDLDCNLDPATQGLVIGLSAFLVIVLVSAVALVLFYRNQGSCLHQLFKGHKWRSRGPLRDQRGYTYDYPEYMITPTKPIPVTEL